MSEANKTIATRFIDAVGCGDVATMQALASKDIAVVTAGSCSLSGTRDYSTLLDIGAGFVRITTSGGLKFRFITLTAEADRVAVEAKGSATMITGKPYNNEYHFLVFIRDGKVYRFVEYLDTQLAEAVLRPCLQQANLV